MKYEGAVDFVGVTFSDSDEATQDFVDQYSLSFPIIADRSAQMFNKYEVPMTPVFLLLTSVDGNDSFERVTTSVDLTAVIESALT